MKRNILAAAIAAILFNNAARAEVVLHIFKPGGIRNESSGPFSHVPGGGNNVSSGATSTLAGGSTNDSRAPTSSVSGGSQNVTTGVTQVLP